MTTQIEAGHAARTPSRTRGHRGLAALGALLLLAGAACGKTSTCPAGLSREGGACVDPNNWILVANNGGSIGLLDTATGLVHGPYLQGQLGSAGGGLFDVAVTPDGKTALVSNFGDSRVFFIDLTDLTAPAVLGNLDVGMFAEDVALSKDGKFALVTDGGFAPRTVSIDVQARAIVQSVQQRDVYTNASAVAPDGTVVTAAYFGGMGSDPYQKPILLSGAISAWVLGAGGRLTHEGDHQLMLRANGDVTADLAAHPIRPVNVAVAPDGKTVLVPDVSPYNGTSALDPAGDYTAGKSLFAIGVYQITAPGVLAFKGAITGLTHAVQSIAFSDTGHEAYLLGNGAQNLDAAGLPVDPPPNDRLLVLKISAPGVVALDATRSADLGRRASSQLFGVDNLVARRGKVYASYSTLSVSDGPLRVITEVDLATMAVRRLPAGLAADGVVAGLALVPRRFTAAAVPAGVRTCAGVCGTANVPQGCFCDADCATWGDCCTDRVALCTACDPATCTGGKTCTNLPGGTFACGCPAGSADDGAGGCADVDECTTGAASCRPGATCQNFSGGFTCQCPAGFASDGGGGCQCPYGTGDDGSGACVAIDQCASGAHACRPEAACTPAAGGAVGYQCECTAPFEQDGFGGCQCPAGHEPDGAGGCVDVDECATGVDACHAGATCRNDVGRYFCDCEAPLVVTPTGGCE